MFVQMETGVHLLNIGTHTLRPTLRPTGQQGTLKNIILLFFTGEVVELLLKNVDKPSVYLRALAASALWALLTNNQKVRLMNYL